MKKFESIIDDKIKNKISENCEKMNKNSEQIFKGDYKDSDIKINEIKKNELGFIDLCAGTGGFHTALDNIEEYNTKCILASDIDKNCRKVYFINHGIPVHNDLKDIEYKNIKNIDIVCAGFPCQPFSVAGKRLGLDDARGTVIHNILEIVKTNKPKMIVLENVKGLKSMKNKDKNNEEVMAYKLIGNTLSDLDYYYYDRVISPHEINIPQKRERVVIIGIRKDVIKKKFNNNEEFQKNRLKFIEELIKKRKCKNKDKNIYQNEKDIKIEFKLNKEQNNTLNLWREFVNMKEWDKIDNIELSKTYLKHFCNKSEEQIDKVKKHRNFKQTHFFTDFKYFKKNDIIPKNIKYKNRKSNKISKSVKKKCDELNCLYDNNTKFKQIIDKFLKKNKGLIETLSYQNRYLEYSGGQNFGSECKLNNFFAQFRMSGVRIRKSNYFPTLVKSGPLPVIIKKNRFLSDVECGNLQSFKKNFIFLSKSSAIKQTGNAVNTEVIELMIISGFDIMKLDKYKKI